MHARDLVKLTPQGLYCDAGDFYVDPVRPVPRAVITHGHSDHARAGHGAVLATPETLAIMAARYGESFAGARQPLLLGRQISLGDVTLRLEPAGHILGSAQAVLEKGAARLVVSGDYKRRRDPTCPPFVPVPCDVFITEATFALPVFRHPDAAGEIARLLHSLQLFPERPHLVGAYSLGKAQRVICLAREGGYDAPVYLHGAMIALCDLYCRWGVPLGTLIPVSEAKASELPGTIVLAPPSALGDRWTRRLGDPVLSFASGWMRIRARARQQGVELPLVISDHADWDELLDTIKDASPQELWVTHGQEEALVHAAAGMGIRAHALAMQGYGDEGETPAEPGA